MKTRVTSVGSVASILALALAASGGLGCSSSADGPSPPKAEAPADRLEGSIGPQGGTLEGSAGSRFEGVKIEIPAGALDRTAHVTVRPTSDPTPLPLLAEAVGQQFAFEGEGASLAKPARVTLPFDADSVGSFSRFAKDVKVWMRVGDEMKLVEPSSVGERAVTIDLPAFTTAGAGIKDLTSALDCLKDGSCIPPKPPIGLDQTCTEADGVCMQSFPMTTRAENQIQWATDRNAIYYTTRPAVDQLQGVRFDLLTGKTTRSAAVRVTGRTRLNPSVAWAGPKHGYLLVGVGDEGLAEFGVDDQGSLIGQILGPANLPGGARTSPAFGAWHTQNGNEYWMDGQDLNWYNAPDPRAAKWGGALQLPAMTPLIAADGRAGSGRWYACGRGSCIGKTGLPLGTAANFFNFAPLEPEVTFSYADDRLGAATAVASGPNGAVAVRLSPLDPATPVAGIVVTQPTQGGVRRVLPTRNALDIAFDGKGGLWVTIAGEARVRLYKDAFSATSYVDVPLSTAPADSGEYRGRVPRGIKRLFDGSVVLMTVGGDVIRLTRG